MATSIDWQTSAATSALHAAERIMRGVAVVDPRLHEALAEPAQRLADALEQQPLDAEIFWSQLLPLDTTISARERISVAVSKGIGLHLAATAVDTLAPLVSGVERSLAETFPNLAEELALRLSPWREQWEARGPGLLHALGKLSDQELLPVSAAVILVQPAVGGSGQAFPAYNRVVFEALLADPNPRLPELVRLGWLLAQLNLDLPRYADRLPRERLRRVAQCGLVPLLLAAAERAELARLDAPTISAALEAWELNADGRGDLADILQTWYGTFSDHRPDFVTGLVALDELLAD